MELLRNDRKAGFGWNRVMIVGISEKSLSFHRKTDPWMTSKFVFSSVQQRNPGRIVSVLSDLPGLCLVVQWKGKPDWLVCGLLSPAHRWTGFFWTPLQRVLPQEVWTSADSALLWFHGLTTHKPKQCPFPATLFTLLFPGIFIREMVSSLAFVYERGHG